MNEETILTSYILIGFFWASFSLGLVFIHQNIKQNKAIGELTFWISNLIFWPFFLPYCLGLVLGDKK